MHASIAKRSVATKIGIIREIGFIIAAIPKTSVRFATLAPMAFPSARPYLFFLIACRQIDASGREVPIAIIVAPTKPSVRLNISVISIAELTTNPELTRTIIMEIRK
jgi:hypothetical protein